MICVTDTRQFFDLIDVIRAFEEQVIYSDVVLINKIDLADEELLTRIEKEITNLNSEARIIRTLYCDAVGEILKETKTARETASPKRTPASGHSPKKNLLVPKETVDKTALKKFLEAIVDFAFRIKGFVLTSEGVAYIDITEGEGISVQETTIDVNEEKYGINIISISGSGNEEKILEAWEEITSIPCSLI
jgi:G3E family GTPase